MVSLRQEYTACIISPTKKAENLYYHHADVVLPNDLLNGEKIGSNAKLVSAGTWSRK